MIDFTSKLPMTDGKDRYKTDDKLYTSKYPRPKTLFKVNFIKDSNDKNDIDYDELSKFVISVDKPNIAYTTKQMNQYNRIRYIYENIKYGPLKITFIDVKDNPIQQKFFKYLKKNNDDINYNKVNDWGLNINSNKKMFDKIIIEERFLKSYISYYVINPVLKDITFGTDKMGDWGYNEIIVSFDVESVGDIIYNNENNNGKENSKLEKNENIINEIKEKYNNREKSDSNFYNKYSTKFFEKLNLK